MANEWLYALDQALDLIQLREVRDRFHVWLDERSLQWTPDALNEEINQFHDRLIQLVVERTVRNFVNNNGGAMPGDYAFVLFGSGGRREQTPWSDQDNWLIYHMHAGQDEHVAADYFHRLAVQISDHLCQVGYPPCVGNILCANEKWCQTDIAWQAMIERWWEQCFWEDVRYLLVTADARVIAGNPEVWKPIRERYLDKVKAEPELLKVMLKNTLYHKVALGVFGHFLKERYGPDAGGIDVKYGGYIPLVNAIRLLAVMHHVPASSTLARIEGLSDYFDASEIQAWREALLVLMYWRANTPFDLDNGLYNSNGKLRVHKLNREQVKSLKSAFRVAMKLQKFIERVTHFRRD
jgi:CBS domain-containing protein